MSNRTLRLVAALACLLLTSSLAAQVLKMATVAPQGNSGWQAIHDAGEEIAAATGGRVKVQLYPGGVMGNDSAVLKKMRAGQLQGASFSAGGISEVYRDFQVMSLPMLFRDFGEVDYVRPQIQPILIRGLEEKGYVPVAVTEVGFAYLMSNAPIRSLADLKGKRIWIPEADPISETAFRTMGVPPTPRPISDVLTGLQTGMIDSFANSPIGAIALQWFTRVKYLTNAPLIYTYGTVLFSKAGLAGLSDADREAVKRIMKKHLEAWDKSSRQESVKAMETLKKQGIQVLAVPANDLKAMEDVAQKATQDLVSRKLFSPDLVQKIQNLLATFRASKGK